MRLAVFPFDMAQRRGSRRKWWIGGVVCLVALAGAGVALRAAFKPNITIDPSKLAQVERGDLAKSVVATGKIQPKSRVEIKSKASGIVKKILVDYGQFVHQGQVLLELDKEDLQAHVHELTASLEAAQAAVESAEATHERNKTDAEGTDVPFLKSALERSRKMVQQGLAASSTLEDSEKAYQMALNKQSSAARAVSVSRAEVAKAKAQVAQARAALERAEEDLRNSTIVSPIDGLALSKDVEVGNAVSSILVLGSQATLLMTLGDVSDVYVLGKVDQADIGKVYLGQKARIVVESFKDRKFEGQVTKIAPLGVEKDNVTTFEVRVSIHNPGQELKANMSANAEIVLDEKKNILLVPESAIAYDRQRNASVEIPDSTSERGRRKIPVVVGMSNGVKTELVSGLKENDKVIVQ